MASSSDSLHGFECPCLSFSPPDKQCLHSPSDGDEFPRRQLGKDGKTASKSNFTSTLKVHHAVFACCCLSKVKTGLRTFPLLTTGIQLAIFGIQFPMPSEDVIKLHTEVPEDPIAQICNFPAIGRWRFRLCLQKTLRIQVLSVKSEL